MLQFGKTRTVFQQNRNRCLTLANAKNDKKGSKKGVSALAGLLKKKQEKEADPGVAAGRATPLQYGDPEVRGMLFFLATSYYKATKSYLMDEVELEQLPDAMYHAGFACTVHDRFQEGVTDPTFIYANKAALELWETSWDQFVGMPSRLSAVEDPETQQYRQFVLDSADTAPNGFLAGQEGWRISQSGKPFKMRDVAVFNIYDFTGEKIGQAEIFREYEMADGTVAQVTCDPWQPREVVLPPSEEEIQAAETAVEDQAAWVRNLKEAQGRTNQDPDVQAAVAELKARKEVVTELRRRTEEALRAAEAAFDGLE